MNKRKVLAGVAGLAVAGSLVGLGAGASFTDAVAATQNVTAGQMNLGIDEAGGAKTYTLPATSPEASTFTTGPQQVTTRNNGNITANAIQLSASDNNNNAALEQGLQVKIVSSGQTAYDGPLTGLEASPIAIQGPVAPGATDPFTVEFYANDLPSAAQGGTVIPTITVTYSG